MAAMKHESLGRTILVPEQQAYHGQELSQEQGQARHFAANGRQAPLAIVN